MTGSIPVRVCLVTIVRTIIDRTRNNDTARVMYDRTIKMVRTRTNTFRIALRLWKHGRVPTPRTIEVDTQACPVLDPHRMLYHVNVTRAEMGGVYAQRRRSADVHLYDFVFKVCSMDARRAGCSSRG